jgi:hypothetical protein
VKRNDTRIIAERQAQLAERLYGKLPTEEADAVLGGGNIEYEIAARTRAIPCGGLGLLQQLVEHIGLRAAIDSQVKVFKRHVPYRESDHVLNLVYNILTGGTCLEDLELRRRDLNYLDALGAKRIPDPTTAGDFLRRFDRAERVEDLMEAQNAVRQRVWKGQPRRAKQLALIDGDGTIVPTAGECKQGMDISYNGKWGYGPLVVSLANSQEVLYVVNRSASRPSHEGAVKWFDKAIAWARGAGFAAVRLRGDTDFSLTGAFDRWTAAGVEFVFGLDAQPGLVARANVLPASAWRPLVRRGKRRRTALRQRPENVKATIVKERGFLNQRLATEYVAEMEYRPTKATRAYRLVVLLKIITVERGGEPLFDELRCHFYVTNVPPSRLSTDEVVFEANARCNQENLIEQLKNGVQAMRLPVADLVGNWAYMVIASLAWNLKAWLGLVLPEELGAGTIRRVEFRRFLNELILLPCQILSSGRRLIYRLLTVSGWARVLLEGSLWFKRARLT